MVETDQTTDNNINRATDEVIGGVSAVVNAALGVFGDVARRAAEATVTRERTVVEPEPGATPVNVVVHYSAATVANIVEIVGKAVRDSTATARAGAGSSRPADADRGRPTVSAGEVLRIPLSIENPDALPMQQLRFATLAMQHRDSTPGAELGTGALRFEPQTLTIAPHDFEKLTVFIDTQIDTAPGHYDAVIELVGTPHQVTVRFAVIGAAAPAP